MRQALCWRVSDWNNKSLAVIMTCNGTNELLTPDPSIMVAERGIINLYLSHLSMSQRRLIQGLFTEIWMNLLNHSPALKVFSVWFIQPQALGFIWGREAGRSPALKNLEGSWAPTCHVAGISPGLLPVRFVLVLLLQLRNVTPGISDRAQELYH